MCEERRREKKTTHQRYPVQFQLYFVMMATTNENLCCIRLINAGARTNRACNGEQEREFRTNTCSRWFTWNRNRYRRVVGSSFELLQTWFGRRSWKILVEIWGENVHFDVDFLLIFFGWWKGAAFGCCLRLVFDGISMEFGLGKASMIGLCGRMNW